MKYREVTPTEIREAFRPQLSVLEIKRAMAEAAGIAYNPYFCDPCCICGATPTFLFGVIARDRITLMTFTVCNNCIKEHWLVPSDPGSQKKEISHDSTST